MRILIAEDEPVQRRVLHGLLTKLGHEVVVASDGQQAWSLLTENEPPDLAILDWIMPGMDGLHICRRLRAMLSRPYTYILVLTGRDHKDDLVEALEAGADDYLTKPFDVRELKARLLAGKRVLDLQHQLVKANQTLQIQANHDALTGILNRGAVVDILAIELARSRREQKPLGVIMADIDFFKSINDTHGHTTGDMVLRHIAQTIRSVTRAYDSVGRYGGEEFLILVPGCDLIQSAQKAASIANAVTEKSVLIPGKDPIPVTLSLGVLSVWASEDSNAVLEAVDLALYQAKRGGRNRVQIGVWADAVAPTP